MANIQSATAETRRGKR